MLVLSACGGGSSSVATAAMTSEERPAAGSSDVPAPDANSEDYCVAAKEAADMGLDVTADPEETLRALERIAALAPQELQDDFDTLLGVIDKLEALDEGDMESITGAFEILLDPELVAASEAIDAYTRATCGFSVSGGGISDPGGSGDFDFDFDDPGGFDDTTDGEGSLGPDAGESAEGEVGLEDVTAVKDANAAESWVDKLTGTFILGGQSVQVSADSDRLSVDEALAACNALLDGLSEINPDVEVTVLNAETELATSAPDGTCAPA